MIYPLSGVHFFLGTCVFMIFLSPCNILFSAHEKCFLFFSLQNRCNVLRIYGEERRKSGEREARVACEGRRAKKLALRARLAFASVPLKYAKNYACSAGYLFFGSGTIMPIFSFTFFKKNYPQPF